MTIKSMQNYSACKELNNIGVALINYAVRHVRNTNSNFQGRSPNVVKVIFHTIRNCS